MSDDNRVQLAIGGAVYEGWKSVRVSLSLARLSGTFELSVSDRFPGQPQRYAFRLNQRCTVSLRGQQVISGFLEEIAPSFDRSSHELSLRGRDATCDLVDCSIEGPPTQWRKQSLLRIAQDVCKPFGIPVRTEAASLGEPFDDARTNEGDTASAFLVRLCKQRGVLPLTYGDGALALSKAGARGRGGDLVLGDNLLRGSAASTSQERFSRYVVKGHGQRAGQPAEMLSEAETKLFRDTYNKPSALAADSAVPRYRPKVILAEAKGKPEAYQALADWEAGVRAGQSRQADYTTQDWGPSAGALWRINTLVTVRDDLLSTSGEWLVEAVAYSMDPQEGTRAELKLVHPQAYLAMPAIAQAITGGFD
ncbi:MAG: hypothetical protein C4525_03175 [Desulfarculus sp.]|nr:MAG: hypothetical protein C4525_03175 [Desulfarculus sp.]